MTGGVRRGARGRAAARAWTARRLESLQLERLRASIQHAYEHNACYRRSSTRAACVPRICAPLRISARFPFTTKEDLRAAYPFGFFAVPHAIRWRACTPPRAPPASRRWSATRRKDIATWSELVARSIRAAGGRRGMKVHVAYGYGLFTGGLGRALRRGGGRLHGDSDVGRTDRAAGASSSWISARHHHDHAELHARSAG